VPSSLMQNDARKLDQLFGMVTHQPEYLQTTTGVNLGFRSRPVFCGERTQGGSGARFAHLLSLQAHRQQSVDAWIVP